MKQIVIENPILNSPFEEPTRHFRFSDEGITDQIVHERRVSSYFIHCGFTAGIIDERRAHPNRNELHHWRSEHSRPLLLAFAP